MEMAIRADELSKRYGDLEALAGLDLEVTHGEVFGYLGLNGAGKTTTIRLLLGMLQPTSGRPRSSPWMPSGTRWQPIAGSPTSAARPACGRR